MKKTDLIENITKSNQSLDISKRATETIIDNVFNEIAKAIRRDKRFIYPGFGTFSLRKRKSRTGRNPRTGEEIKIPASTTIGFRPAPSLKRSL